MLRSDGTPAGFTKSRRLVHRDGDWHAALHIWVAGVAPDGVPFVLFQRRSLTKDTFPGFLDVAVGGHIRAGETPAQTSREAEEEIGLSVDLTALERVGRRFVSLEMGNVHDNELQEVFAIRRDAPLDAYRLHPEEVDALVAVGLDDARRLFAGTVTDVAALERTRYGEARPIRLARLAFTPYADDYVLETLGVLRALLAGEPFEPFDLRSGPVDPA